MYEFLLIIHLLAVIAWLGGGLALNVIVSRTPPQDRGAVIPQAAFYGKYVLTGASVVVVLAGGALVAKSPLDPSFTDTWIVIGLVIWLVSGYIGGAVIGKSAEQILELAESPEPDLTKMEELRQKVILFSRIDLVLITAAVVEMVTKPGA